MNNKMLGLAIAIAAEAFKNTVDKQGKPYILHCLTVMNGVPDEEKIPAVLHDFVEDVYKDNFNAGFAFLRGQGFDEDDIRVIDILTHRKEEDYFNTYIKKIGNCQRCTRIKLRDLEHNSNISRIKGDLTKQHFDKVSLYHISYKYLLKI